MKQVVVVGVFYDIELNAIFRYIPTTLDSTFLLLHTYEGISKDKKLKGRRHTQ